MRQRYDRHDRYRLTRPPRALMQARLDNIAIVPASMLASKEGLAEQVKKLPRGEVLLCHTKENTKQKRMLERVKEVFGILAMRSRFFLWSGWDKKTLNL